MRNDVQKASLSIYLYVIYPLEVYAQAKIEYPKTKKVEQTDDYHGTKISDPYRWLEDDNSAETKAWVEAQNKVTFDYLNQIPERAKIKARLTELVELRKIFARRSNAAASIFITKNDGLQNQSGFLRRRFRH